MPKSLLQEIVFTVLMVLVMVYAMICYNIALNIGGMTNEVFLFIVLGISSVSVLFMCPLMSLIATLLFKDAGSQFVAVWFQTTALCWQLFVAGPVVRKLFALLLRAYNAAIAKIRRNRGGDKPSGEDAEQMTI